MQKPSGKWCEARPARGGMRARRQALRERERACVRERGGTEAAARLCAAEVHGCARRRSVHGWHALESCGLLSLVRLVSRRRKRTPVDFAPGVTAFELTLPRRGGSQLTVTFVLSIHEDRPPSRFELGFRASSHVHATARHSPLYTRSRTPRTTARRPHATARQVPLPPSSLRFQMVPLRNPRVPEEVISFTP
jgi:hypothetical protein